MFASLHVPVRFLAVSSTNPQGDKLSVALVGGGVRRLHGCWTDVRRHGRPWQPGSFRCRRPEGVGGAGGSGDDQKRRVRERCCVMGICYRCDV